MSPMDTRDLSGPHLRYSRPDDAPTGDPRVEALELARRIEELLADTRSVGGTDDDRRAASPSAGNRAHSTRIARAMAAGLVDELDVLVRPARKSGVA